MSQAVLLDTHAWGWSFYAGHRLSETARQMLSEADMIYVSPVSFFEMGQKARLGKWPEVSGRLDELPGILIQQGGTLAALTAEIALNAGRLAWDHRDPFDRIIAATASVLNVPVVTRDAALHTFPDIHCIW